VKIGLSTAADGVDTQLAEASQSAALEWVWDDPKMANSTWKMMINECKH